MRPAGRICGDYAGNQGNEAMLKTYKGYEYKACEISHTVFKDGQIVAAGGTLGGGIKTNEVYARRAIDGLVAGTRKPLNMAVSS